MPKLTLDSVGQPASSQALLNNNFVNISEAIENTFSRDGMSPNELNSNLDLNGYRILNIAAPTEETDPVRLIDLEDVVATGLGSIATADYTISTAAPSGGENGDLWFKVT